MPKRKRLLIDVDEVLADFQTPVFELIHLLFGKYLTPHDFKTWDILADFTDEEKSALFAEMAKPGFCRGFSVVEGALEAVKRMREIVDVYPVTNPFHMGPWAADRNEWLQENFGFERGQIVHTSAKHLVNGNAILDDNPTHVVDWLGENPTKLGMLWHIPNTRMLTHYDHLRVRSWDEVLKQLTNLVESDNG